MYYKGVCFVLLTFLTLACGQEGQAPSFRVRGHLEGLDAGAVCLENTNIKIQGYIDLLNSSPQGYGSVKDLKEIVARMEKVEIGRITPDFEMDDSYGTPRRLSDFYAGTDYLLQDFWASTCEGKI